MLASRLTFHYNPSVPAGKLALGLATSRGHLLRPPGPGIPQWPRPTHAQDRSQPGCLEKLVAAGQALDAFEAELLKTESKDHNSLRSGIAALVQSKALLLLGRIIHWLQQRPSPSILEPGASTWIGSALWRTATRVLWRLATFLDKFYREELAYCHPAACAQLLASGMKPSRVRFCKASPIAMSGKEPVYAMSCLQPSRNTACGTIYAI